MFHWHLRNLIERNQRRKRSNLSSSLCLCVLVMMQSIEISANFCWRHPQDLLFSVLQWYEGFLWTSMFYFRKIFVAILTVLLKTLNLCYPDELSAVILCSTASRFSALFIFIIRSIIWIGHVNWSFYIQVMSTV